MFEKGGAHDKKRPGKTVQLQASIPTWLMGELKKQAKNESRSVSNLISLELARSDNQRKLLIACKKYLKLVGEADINYADFDLLEKIENTI